VSAEFKAKVNTWLTTMGHTPVEQNDPKADWHFLVDYPVHSAERLGVLELAAQPGRVIIATAAELSPEHRDGFAKLDDDAKEAFQWRFRHALINNDSDFQIDGVDTLHDCPTRF
jgi:hypothetical protein